MANIKNLTTWWAGIVSLNPENVEASAANQLTGAIPVLFRIAVPDAATGDVNLVVPFAIRVLDVWVVKTGAAGGAANTVQLKSTANPISDAISTNIADQAIARATTIDDAFHEIAAGGVLRVTRTKAGGNAACAVYVMAARI